MDLIDVAGRDYSLMHLSFANTYEVATACALALGAEKLICIIDGPILDEWSQFVGFASSWMGSTTSVKSLNIVDLHLSIIVTHEVGHQWFGNLVTLEWWTHLRLNEGFATWFLEETAGGLRLDSLKQSHPVEVEVQNASSILDVFDAISYEKGSSLVRMLKEYLGDDMFQTRFTLFDHFSVAETSDEIFGNKIYSTPLDGINFDEDRGIGMHDLNLAFGNHHDLYADLASVNQKKDGVNCSVFPPKIDVQTNLSMVNNSMVKDLKRGRETVSGSFISSSNSHNTQNRALQHNVNNTGYPDRTWEDHR
ncbi:DNA-binding, integrase-type protein [Tanacetum coccineum]